MAQTKKRIRAPLSYAVIVLFAPLHLRCHASRSEASLQRDSAPAAARSERQSPCLKVHRAWGQVPQVDVLQGDSRVWKNCANSVRIVQSEEHTSELQSR